ncbi:hypothetical protein [Flavobacterium psychrotrophum]|uniref:hypothetical protein n=1 Tax=Flavobacterium psychrotrophum TaxID=2294119 RepID=UPI000E323BDE|nr:hypothetical protein [Flavobacterium psychrotrophum]
MGVELQIEKKKLELIQWLSTVEDMTVIDQIAALRNRQKDWWEDISLDERKAVEQGIAEADAGKLNPNSEARKLYAKWL